MLDWNSLDVSQAPDCVNETTPFT